MKKLLLKSKMANQPVDIIYMDQKGKITQRTIFVKRIEDNQVIAYCTFREKQRTFDLENILAAQKGSRHHETKQTYAWSKHHVGVQQNVPSRA